MSVRGRVLSLTALMAVASCAQPNNAPPPKPEPGVMAPGVRGAISGERRQILEFYFVNPDCSSSGTPVIKVAKPPQHGKVEIVEGTAFADFAKTSNFAACNAKKVTATLVFYTSEPGYLGDDEIALDRIGVLGAYGYHTYTIKVR